MNNPKQHIKEQKLSFYMTQEHACSYLPGKHARTLIADPGFSMNGNVYTSLARIGFRRSGSHIYKPQCQSCNACIAIRLPVNKFVMNRNQKRNWRLNNDLTITKLPAGFNNEHYKLYQRYLAARHPDGGMDNPEPENYIDFLMTNWMTTEFYEIKETDKLLAVAVVDKLLDGLSAVYTFYDPDAAHRSLGRYAVLCEIKEAQNRGLSWLYLGYWIADCKKMRYKDEYQPLEYFYHDTWHRAPPSK